MFVEFVLCCQRFFALQILYKIVFEPVLIFFVQRFYLCTFESCWDFWIHWIFVCSFSVWNSVLNKRPSTSSRQVQSEIQSFIFAPENFIPYAFVGMVLKKWREHNERCFFRLFKFLSGWFMSFIYKKGVKINFALKNTTKIN